MKPSERISKRETTAAVDAALARLWRGGSSDADSARGSAASDDEREIAGRVETIWNDLPLLRERERYAELLGAPTLRERIVGAYRGTLNALSSVGRVPAFAATAALILIATVAVLQLPSAPRGSPARSFQTARAQTQLIELEDGSAVTLGAQSALQVAYTPGARNVTLTSGEAFFSVTHDPSRPFVVEAGDTTIQVVGTKFNVNRTANGVRVSVLEGVVRVIEHRPAPTPGAADRPAVANEVALRAGQLASLEPGAADLQVSAVAVAQPGSWRTGSLTYEDATLAQIVADANRYYPGQIRIASARGAEMRLTTAFRTTKIDQFLETVETALPLDVRRGPAGEITIVERR